MNLGFTGQALITEQVIVDAATLARIQDFFADCSAVLGHLETSILPDGPVYPMKDRTCHFAAARHLSALKALGLSHLNLAGNHAFDLGPDGIVATLNSLAMHDLFGIGGGIDRHSACAPAIVTTPTHRLALWGRDAGPQPDVVYASDARPPLKARPGIAGLRIDRELKVDPAGARELNRISLETGHSQWSQLRAEIGYDPDATNRRFYGTPFSVSDQCQDHYRVNATDWSELDHHLHHTDADCHAIHLHQHHWGYDWKTSPQWISDLGKSLIDLGMSIVAVTGNPRVHPIYRYRHGLILTGLGGLIFHTKREAKYDDLVWSGQLVRITVSGQLIQSINRLPIQVGGPLGSERTLKAGEVQTLSFEDLPSLE
ncbi:MAG: CapA family protein [Litorivicinaceae bacterium]